MAHIYVDSNATGSPATGADWANAYLTLGSAFAAGSAGDNFWVASDHSESQASIMQISSKGTRSATSTIISVDKTGSVPPVEADMLAGAVVATTGNNRIDMRGSHYCWGLTISAGSGAVGAYIKLAAEADAFQIYENCKFHKNGTTASIRALELNSGGRKTCTLINCTAKFGDTGDRVMLDSPTMDAVRWLYSDTPIDTSGSIPTTFFRSDNSGAGGNITCIGVDFTDLGSNAIWDETANKALKVRLVDCKLSPTIVLNDSAWPLVNQLELIRCDSGVAAYRNERYMGGGVSTTETAVIRTGGATDGTTPISWKVVTSTYADFLTPFESFPIHVWNDSTSQITVTVYGTWGGGAVPNNDDCWIEVSYLDSAADTMGAIAQNGQTTWLNPAVAQDADAVSVWAADTSPARVNFKMSTTFTPAQKGLLTILIKCGKPSDTFYFDPKAEITG